MTHSDARALTVILAVIITATVLAVILAATTGGAGTPPVNTSTPTGTISAATLTATGA